MATTTKDAQYKDGYQVAEGGDYLVHKVNPEVQSQFAEHQVIRIADGRVLGRYSSRQAACKRAQQFGGNTRDSRRAGGGVFSGRNAFNRLSPKEQTVAEKIAMTKVVVQTTDAIEKEREHELHELYEALRKGTPGADAAIHDHYRTDYINRLQEIISESKLLAEDARFESAAMKEYLRQYSLGSARTQNRWNTGLPNHAYRRVHVEAAWLDLPERKRLQRAQQNYKLRHLVQLNGFDPADCSYESVSLRPVESWELEAIAEVLKQFPVGK